jgi:hypothetical protein
MKDKEMQHVQPWNFLQLKTSTIVKQHNQYK